MLTLQLTLDDRQVTVHTDVRASHSFSLFDLGQTDRDWKDFLKDPRPYGEKLFQALFKDGSVARTEFDELSKQTERTIVLVLESPELDGVAWEYAYNESKYEYVVEDCAFMRALPEKERPHTNGHLSESVERVPLLFIPANPLVDLNGEPMRELDIESEWREMTQHIVKSNAPFDMIELRPATPAALQSVMARFQNGMIAHFSGHGAATKDGAFLLFENENGSSNPLEAREFVREVKDQAWIGFLSACQSAVAERTAFGNLARELVKAGVPFGLGMQFNLPDPFAPNISGQFYNYLSQGHAVTEAVRRARRAVKRENEFYVGMIALYAARPDETGKMGWTGSGTHTLSTFAAADVSDLPTPSGFIGRQRELMNIGTNLLGKKKPNTVTLHGAGGIGKTALMRQVLLRFAPSFESALAIALDPLPSLGSVLGRLERFLNLPSLYAKDIKEREQIVRERLTGKRTLLGLDNFETLNYALNEMGSDEEKTTKSLHAFFKSLTANGVTLCVTSREVTNLPGETIVEIQGLPNDVGGRLFQGNVVRRKDEVYVDKTQQVSKMVGGHPLALRLLASTFDDQVGTSLDLFIENLQFFLSNANDKWGEKEYDKFSLLFASFNLSINLLTDEMKRVLGCLSVFHGTFWENLAIPVLIEDPSKLIDEDGISRHFDLWEEHQEKVLPMLRMLSEKGLLERILILVEDINVVFYRMNPALKPFASLLINPVQQEFAKEGYFRTIQMLMLYAYSSNKNTPGIFSNPFIATICKHATLDLINFSKENNDLKGLNLRFDAAYVLEQFGDFDNAIVLYKAVLNELDRLDIGQG